MASKRRRRSKGQNSGDLTGAVLIFLSLAVAGSVAGAYAYYSDARTPIDAATYCPVQGSSAVTAVLIDRTDPFNGIQVAALKAEFKRLAAEFRKHERLDLYTLGASAESVLEPEISLCNPGRGDDLNALTANPELAARRWQDAFEKPIDAAFSQALSKSEANQSPLLEAIQSVSITAFRDISANPQPKRFVIVSDMLQHSDALSHYTGAEGFASFENTENYRRIRTNLAGVDVELLYVRRSTRDQRQGRTHIEFWQDYFSSQGARITSVTSVEG